MLHATSYVTCCKLQNLLCQITYGMQHNATYNMPARAIHAACRCSVYMYTYTCSDHDNMSIVLYRNARCCESGHWALGIWMAYLDTYHHTRRMAYGAHTHLDAGAISDTLRLALGAGPRSDMGFFAPAQLPQRREANLGL